MMQTDDDGAVGIAELGEEGGREGRDGRDGEWGMGHAGWSCGARREIGCESLSLLPELRAP